MTKEEIKMNEITIVKPNKSSQYFQLQISNPFMIGLLIDKNIGGTFFSVGLSKTDLEILKRHLEKILR